MLAHVTEGWRTSSLQSHQVRLDSAAGRMLWLLQIQLLCESSLRGSMQINTRNIVANASNISSGLERKSFTLRLFGYRNNVKHERNSSLLMGVRMCAVIFTTNFHCESIWIGVSDANRHRLDLLLMFISQVMEQASMKRYCCRCAKWSVTEHLIHVTIVACRKLNTSSAMASGDKHFST